MEVLVALTSLLHLLLRMASLLFTKRVLKMFYTMIIAFTSLQLMGLNQASSLSDTDTLPNTQYFFYQNSEYPRDCRDVQRQCASKMSNGVYVIKPDGFREPFEVFCNNDIDSGGWTVIQRRDTGILNFNRTWAHYSDGFGFLSTDFFLGNEKLAYLTNQAAYELLIEVELENGCSFSENYKGFRIADQFGQYRLQHVGSIESNASLCLTGCPADVFFDTSCTEICFCSNNCLVNCSAISCDDNAICVMSNGFGTCSCNDGYQGDGLTCTPITTTATPTTATTTTPPEYRDCQDVYDDDKTEDGIYIIRPDGWTDQPFSVSCNMDNGGGWTVFQRRINDNQEFYQPWELYRNGFGNLTENFWLGNEKLFYLTNQRNYRLRLDIVTSDGTSLDAEWTEFQIQDESDKYRMNKLGSRSTTSGGSAGFGLSANLNQQFSTYDSDNDDCGDHNCADEHRSGWWHSNVSCHRCWGARCDRFRYSSSCSGWCTSENLNGDYNGGDGERIFSSFSNYCNPTFVELRIRPSS